MRQRSDPLTRMDLSANWKPELPSPPTRAQLHALAALLEAFAPTEGRFDLSGHGVSAIRLSHKTNELIHAVQRPALCLVAQGEKRVFLGKRVYDYDASHMLVFSVHLPVCGQVIRASLVEPYLCFMLELDRHRLAALLPHAFPLGVPDITDDEGLYLAQADGQMVETASSLLLALQPPEVDEMLASRLVNELLVRLLRSPVGGRVMRIALADSGLTRVAQAIGWLRGNYAKPISIEQLATLIHMSVSSFHQHFRKVTGMSPLQFQKALRLQEARRIMLDEGLDAASASRQVGYASPSQFSREFTRFFGHPPRQHIEQLRIGSHP
jgi:AraC-like DNA-binding protein